MSQSKHQAIRVAVAALFNAATALAGGRIYQNRAFALANDDVSQIHVNLAAAEHDPALVYHQHPRDWDSEIECIVLARKDGSTEAPDVADALWVDMYARVMADQTLGGLADGLLPLGMTSDADQADTSLCRLTWRFIVKHRTDNNSIAA